MSGCPQRLRTPLTAAASRGPRRPSVPEGVGSSACWWVTLMAVAARNSTASPRLASSRRATILGFFLSASLFILILTFTHDPRSPISSLPRSLDNTLSSGLYAFRLLSSTNPLLELPPVRISRAPPSRTLTTRLPPSLRLRCRFSSPSHKLS